jgi:hypothetical protein
MRFNKQSLDEIACCFAFKSSAWDDMIDAHLVAAEPAAA